MKVAVVGATGRLGLECTKLLLEGGHSVFAICRSEEKAYTVFSCIPRAQRANLQVFPVVDFEVSKLKEAFTGCESIIFTAYRSGGPKYVDYGGLVNCIEALKQLNNSGLNEENDSLSKCKFVLISSLGVTRPYWPIYIMLNTLGGRVMSYKLKGEDALRAAQLPFYTIIRPGRLMPETEAHLRDADLIASQGDKITGQIVRSDVAAVAIHAALNKESGNKCTFELISAASKNIESEHAGNVNNAPARGRDYAVMLSTLSSDLQVIKN